MTDNNINIVPCDVSVINKVGSFTIMLQNFKLGISVDLIVSVFNTDKKFISTVLLPLEGEDYLLWGNDDNYLVNYICNKMNFTPSTNEESKE